MSGPDLRGARVVGQKVVFQPPTAVQIRHERAMAAMNQTQELARAWHAAMTGMHQGFSSGLDEVEGVVPAGGAALLALLGFHAQFVCKVGEGDKVRVALADPFAGMRVLS